jgi:hypothetical protein
MSNKEFRYYIGTVNKMNLETKYNKLNKDPPITSRILQDDKQFMLYKLQRRSYFSAEYIQCVRKVAVHLQKLLEVMSTSVNTGLLA